MEINYNISNENYKVILEKDPTKKLLKDLENLKSDKQILFIYDRNVDKKLINKYFSFLKLFGGKVHKKLVVGGKQNKNEKFLFDLLKILSKLNFSKRSVIISFGGGVVGDVSALAACLYMRGMIYFHIPTTMTAILDRCIGGKTAINFQNKINLIGTYYHPLRVYISGEIVNKIPQREYYAGFAEAIKCGIIGDKNILKILEHKSRKLKKKNFKVFKELCTKVLKIKINFFVNDVYEKNKRLMLNFGHTFAHAIEMASASQKNLKTINHGEAVAVGILCEMFYSKTLQSFQKMITKLLTIYNLPNKINLPKNVDKIKFQKKVFQNLFLDKKKINQFPRYVHINNKIKPTIKELDNLNLLDQTILKFIE